MASLSRRHCLLAAAAALVLFLPPLYFFKVAHQAATGEPVQILTQYLKAIYARDFPEAYRFISLQDQALKKRAVYVRERGPFSGFALEVARKLADSIQVRPVQERLDEEGHTRIRLAYRLPDANAVAPLIFDWDEERLGSVSNAERRKILDSLDRVIRTGGLKIIEGEEEFVMVKESTGWKVLLDWATGIQVRFDTVVPNNHLIEARPTIPETVARSGELFTIGYRVKNRTSRDILARIVHHVEPPFLIEHLDLVECALLLPVRLAPGEEQTYDSTYLIRGDLPDGAKEINVTYEFKVEH
jgi:hypothetical protein